MKRTKNFDSIAIKRQGAQGILQTLQGMSRSQQLAYWQKGTEELRKRQQARRAQMAAAADAPETRSPLPPLREASPPAKAFDCVAAKRLGAEKILAAIACISWEEKMARWQKETEQLRQLQRHRRQNNSGAAEEGGKGRVGEGGRGGETNYRE